MDVWRAFFISFDDSGHCALFNRLTRFIYLFLLNAQRYIDQLTNKNLVKYLDGIVLFDLMMVDYYFD